MELSNFISNCRNRKLINNRGKVVSVGCGHCPDCVSRKASIKERMCKEESKKWRYVYFITLTYDEKNVPLARIVPSGEQMHLFDYTTRFKKNNHYGGYLGTIPCSFNDSKFQQFYEKSQQSKKGRLPLDHSLGVPILRYAFTKDLQNFIKRLRFHVSKEISCDLRYFAISEYGPTSFRPHFHVLLFFNERRLAANIERFVSKSWRFGDIVQEFANKSTACASYVSSYCNSTSRLPVYLSLKSLRPKSYHSIYFGQKISREIRDYFYEDVRRAFEPATYYISSNFFNFVPGSSIERFLYPRCYNFVNQNRATLYQLYTSYSRYSLKAGSTRPSDIARHILVFNRHYLPFLSHLQIVPTPPERTFKREGVLYLQEDKWYDYLFHSGEEVSASDYDIMIYNRIYQCILMSKHFLTFCCAGRDAASTLTLICDYYNQLAQYRLSLQYNMMQKYNKEAFDDCYDAFYFIQSDKHYENVYYNTPYIQKINVIKDKNFNDKIKHKELNDANKIFSNF